MESTTVGFLVGFFGVGLVFIGALSGNKTCQVAIGIIALLGGLGFLLIF